MINIRKEDAEGDDQEKEETSLNYFGSKKVHLSEYQREFELRTMWPLGWTLQLWSCWKRYEGSVWNWSHVVMHMDWLANRGANLVKYF